VGTRLDVWQVVETVRANSGDTSAAADFLAVSGRQVSASLDYYADLKPEVDAWAHRQRDRRDRAGGVPARQAALDCGPTSPQATSRPSTRPSPRTTEVELLGGFIQNLADFADIHDDLPPGERPADQVRAAPLADRD
jgi:hypothetical protein